MATKTEGERALADLAAGKFSFPMVDAIRDHVKTLESELHCATKELERINALHDGALNQLRQNEYTIGRLEGELRNLNARVYALLKANVLTETALRETKRGAAKFVEFLPVARQHAEHVAKMAWAYLSNLDVQGKFETLKAHPATQKARAWLADLDLQAEWAKLKTNPLPKKALDALQAALVQAREQFPVVQKRIAATIEKATAYISEQLHKKTA